jgi:CubicO group peptidase (beta-lactamase class C family)
VRGAFRLLWRPGLTAACLAVSVLAIAGCRADSDPVEGATVRRAPPRLAEHLDTAGIARALARADELPRLRSLLIQWKGRIVGERFYGGATATRRTNIKSASKSIISALVGIAIAQGHIRDVHQTIGELLPTEAAGLDPAKRAITVQDLLTMRSGLQSTSFENYGSWVRSRNWVRDALSRPVVAPRGESGPMIYSTGSTHLLSAILTRATGTSTYRFAERHLASPIGVTLRPWPTDPQGVYFGGNDMYLSPRDLLRLGTLYLQRGEYQGRQIVPAHWVDSSLVPRTSSPWNGNGYGYGWWSRTARGVLVHYAWGYGGQFVFVVPALELVVVMTSDAESRREGGHNAALHRLLEGEIIPAVSDE